VKLILVIFWTVAAALLLATTTVGYIVYHAPVPPNSTAAIECIKAILLCLGGSGVIVSTYFTAVNAFTQRRSEVVQHTFELLRMWDDPNLFAARKLTRRVKDNADNTSKNALLTAITEDEDLRNSTILVLNYFEYVRFSLNTRRIDVALFKPSLGATVIDIADRFLPYARTLTNHSIAKDLEELKKLLK
jgi:hypothetical protein